MNKYTVIFKGTANPILFAECMNVISQMFGDIEFGLDFGDTYIKDFDMTGYRIDRKNGEAVIPYMRVEATKISGNEIEVLVDIKYKTEGVEHEQA